MVRVDNSGRIGSPARDGRAVHVWLGKNQIEPSVDTFTLAVRREHEDRHYYFEGAFRRANGIACVET